MNGEHLTDTQSQPLTPPAVVEPRLIERMGWRIFWTLLLLALLIFLSILSGYSADAAENRQSGTSPLVLAFYYTWYDDNTWQDSKVPDYPVVRYVSTDRAAMGRHIEQAQRNGIDALMVAWYGPTGQWNQTEPNLTALLDEANARNFKIGILFETTSPFFSGPGDATAALRHALSVHANHPAFLRVNGKPVIFFWRPTLWGIDTWRSIRSQVDPNNSSLWISEGVDTSYLSVFDGHHLYSNTWNPPADLTAVNQKFARQVASARQSYGSYKYWVATVMPGYNDTRTGRSNAFAKDREGGAYYERSWSAAIASSPDWVVLTSFNEWPEGSYIEPSVTYGDLYLNLTATWSQRYKSGAGAAAPVAPVANQPAAAAPVAATPDVPTAYVTTPLLNLRGGPGTEFPILIGMPANAALPILGKNSQAGAWWQVSYAGQTGWAAGDYLRLAGPLEKVPTVDLPTRSTAPRSTSLVQDILTGELSGLLSEQQRQILKQKWLPAAD